MISGGIGGRRALNWTSREHLTSPLTVGGDLGERRLAQRFPVVADTEEVTGSNPVTPTNELPTSGNAGQFAVSGPVRRAVYRMESVSLV
jgi:hypothetical protein